MEDEYKKKVIKKSGRRGLEFGEIVGKGKESERRGWKGSEYGRCELSMVEGGSLLKAEVQRVQERNLVE